MGSSPDGKWFLYLKDKQVVAYNIETGKQHDSRRRRQDQLHRRDDDHPYEKPTTASRVGRRTASR